ncbi:MAG: MFS transporter [Nanoarchaeota archaeon]|nr:MFS transporter [Nanoarchaeota archaeon]
MAEGKAVLISLLINIVIPVIILLRFSGPTYLGPLYGLLLAIAFPIGYGIYDLAAAGNVNLLSIIGIIGVGLTGSIGILHLDPELVAIKEAGVPLTIGLIIIISEKTRFSIVRKLFEKVLAMEKITAALHHQGTRDAFDRRFSHASYFFGASFFLSAALNYMLAKIIVVSPPGTVAFNNELGYMTALSFPVIALPMIAVLGLIFWYLLNGIKEETGLEFEALFR